jgi:hypothetical protein
MVVFCDPIRLQAFSYLIHQFQEPVAHGRGFS